MTSTLNQQSSLRRVVSRRRYVHFVLKTANRRLPPEYSLLTRNPFTRVESYFREKLRAQVQRALDADDPYALKRHQAIFYPWAGVSEDDPLQAKVDALLGFGFDQFIEALPHVYLREDHLAPQTFNYTRHILGRAFLMPFDDIVHIEDQPAMQRLAHRFDLDLTVRANSASATASLGWTAAGVAMISELYRSDFEVLGYETVAEPPP